MTVDRDALESRWQANERRLRKLHAMTPLGREINGAEIDRLEGKQDALELELGADGRPGSSRWSGCP
jgi:hypothetical protein